MVQDGPFGPKPASKPIHVCTIEKENIHAMIIDWISFGLITSIECPAKLNGMESQNVNW